MNSTPALDCLPAQEIIASYKNGTYLTHIAEKYDVCVATLYSLLKNHGVYDRDRQVDVRRKHKFNAQIFDKIDTEEKAYWLGFWYADGSNIYKEPSKNHRSRYQACLFLARQDEDHVEKFLRFIGYTGDVKRYTDKDGHNKSGLFLHNKNFCTSLIRAGVRPDKTKVCFFPGLDVVSTELVRHFMRGYFDGDGCISMNLNRIKRSRPGFAIRIVGTDTFLSEYNHTIIAHSGVNSKIYHGNCRQENIKNIYFGGNRSTQVFLDWIYGDASIFLARKYRRYQLLLDINKVRYKARNVDVFAEYYDNERKYRYD